ncbi:MAG: PIN domain-containing protein [Candidatus Sumerlaeota bacterium]|nr:PIN domain-containing protein [Candidatus Sumerlaeota bacterium]
MKKTKVYLDTSIISHYYADDAPTERERTREFFAKYIQTGIYEAFVSPVVLDEIQDTKEEAHRLRLLGVVARYKIISLEIINDIAEISALAKSYSSMGIIPKRKVEDAMHLAIATVKEIDILLSWNFRHLANVNKEIRINAANMQAGYLKPLRMRTPLEMIYEDED